MAASLTASPRFFLAHSSKTFFLKSSVPLSHVFADLTLSKISNTGVDHRRVYRCNMDSLLALWIVFFLVWGVLNEYSCPGKFPRWKGTLHKRSMTVVSREYGCWTQASSMRRKKAMKPMILDVKKMCGFKLLMESLMSVWSLSPLLNFFALCSRFH